MPTVYAIKGWDIHYEKKGGHRPEREVVYHWVPTPTKHDGKSFRRLARHPNSVEVFCEFILLKEIAAKTPKRGVLADEDGPLSAEDCADATGFPAPIF